jgi:ribosomal-protein-alanine N-acetyltransferase
MAPIRIGAAQVPPTSNLDQNLAKTIEYMEKAAAEGVEILCFPETHLPGYRAGILDPEAPCDAIGLARAAAQVSASCRDFSIGVVLGTETPNPDGKPFNSAIVIDQHGETIALHHKSKLTPNDALAYTTGPGPTMFTFKDIPMGVVICFEAFRFPETTRALAEDGATVVFHPQFNHVMPNMEWKLPVHEALLVTRAAENTLYFISANMSHPLNNCRSLAIAPDGLIQEASVLAEQMLLVADVDPKFATHAFLHNDPDRMAQALAELEVDPARTWG